MKDSLDKVNASQVRDRDQLKLQIEMINEALSRFYSGKYTSPLQYEMIKELFNCYLKEDKRLPVKDYKQTLAGKENTRTTDDSDRKINELAHHS